jgi:hypothetical protein
LWPAFREDAGGIGPVTPQSHTWCTHDGSCLPVASIGERARDALHPDLARFFRDTHPARRPPVDWSGGQRFGFAAIGEQPAWAGRGKVGSKVVRKLLRSFPGWRQDGGRERVAKAEDDKSAPRIASKDAAGRPMDGPKAKVL